ncbi:GNAT family N-acetyltransferase [Rheinheimera sp.]|uniref:GNAT family N-acetyltransferase n=1 Tax=Rheinheimera sp. TaxID=1869214 RepID=UPI0023547602|nr:GNAT family N-acetyltransferase [Rheinheimera sp.]
MKMTNIVYKGEVKIDLVHQVNFPLLKHFLSDVSYLYPNFESWLNFKVRRNSRSILLAHDGNTLAGVSILKNVDGEKKISTFYIAPQFRGQMLGQSLMTQSLQFLDSAETFITVSEERNRELVPLLNSNGFKLQKVVPNLYRDGKSELFYSLT